VERILIENVRVGMERLFVGLADMPTGYAVPVSREVAMRLVNYSSELIHQVYKHEKVEDVAQWRDAVRFPA
jgi:hypothetical protein